MVARLDRIGFNFFAVAATATVEDMKKPKKWDFARLKISIIPKKAKWIRIISKGIDGVPPNIPEILTVQDFLLKSEQLELTEGSGEWEVKVYATEDESLEFLPDKSQEIASWDYMRWNYHRFRIS